MFLNRMKISSRLSLGFGLVIVLLAVVAASSLLRLSEFNRSVEDFASERVPKLIAAGNWVETLLQISRQMQDVLVLDNEKQIREGLNSAKKSKAQIQELHDQLEKLVMPGKEKELFQAIVDARAKYAQPEDEFIKTAEQGDYLAAKDVLLGRARPAQLKYIEAINRFSAYQAEQSALDAKATDASYQNARVIVLALSALAVLLGVFAAFTIIRGITRPLQQAVEVASAVARGDLTRHIEVKSSDETGQLLQALKDMNDSLTGIVGGVRSSTDTITTASREIAQGNSDLSQRTGEQAASLEETSSSMEQLTLTVKQNAENARQANQLASNASNIAIRGGQVVGDVVNTMASISDSSRKIVDIISVIEGIAFQTNILALNAAVEAARAGEQGRGFAVVAAEVRNLAQRSAAAAKEIKALIGDSVDKVEVGSKQVDQAGATMTEIVEAVKRVTDIMSEIAAASSEQSTGIEQVNQAILQMDDTTQQNASQVEEAAAAAEAMQEQAKALLEAVSVFKLEGGRASMQKAVAKPTRTTLTHHAPQHGPVAPNTSTHKLAKAKTDKTKEDKDGDWKEF